MAAPTCTDLITGLSEFSRLIIKRLEALKHLTSINADKSQIAATLLFCQANAAVTETTDVRTAIRSTRRAFGIAAPATGDIESARESSRKGLSPDVIRAIHTGS